jgi:integrase
MFKTMEEQADAIYLTMHEIDRIYEIDLSRDLKLQQHRDLFVLGCYTGLRFSDFSIIRTEDIRNNMLYKKQVKSNHWVIIPLRSYAESILKNKFKRGIPKISNTEFNNSLKLIGKLAGLDNPIKFSHKKGNRHIVVCKPKYEWITSHTCRRSFCTNEFLAGTPVELIMKISGHKNLKDFYKYIKISPEEAAEKIKEIWLARNELEVLSHKKLACGWAYKKQGHQHTFIKLLLAH